MEFSFKKMVIEKESKEVEIKGNLTLFLELFLLNNMWKYAGSLEDSKE